MNMHANRRDILGGLSMLKKLVSTGLVCLMMVSVVGCSNEAKQPSNGTELDIPHAIQEIKNKIASDYDLTVNEDGSLAGYAEIDLKSEDMPLQDFPVADEDMEAGMALEPMMNVLADKFIVIKAADGQENDVKAGLETIKQQQIDQWQMYLPEQLEKAENAQIVQEGDYFFYVTYEKTDEMVGLFQGLFK